MEVFGLEFFDIRNSNSNGNRNRNSNSNSNGSSRRKIAIVTVTVMSTTKIGSNFLKCVTISPDEVHPKSK